MTLTRLTDAATKWVAGGVLSALLAPSLVLAQLLPYQSPHKTEGAVTCASSLCHGAIRTWKDSNVLQNEYITWSRVDKHARAYNVLFNAKSVQIAKHLGLKEGAHQAKVCLDCHAHNIPATRHGERFSVSENIGCEACHGPAEKWLRSHVGPDATHQSNLADGLYPTGDATARAKLCLSCHFGNKDKLVTHRIMGAGHPRMSFELDTFTELAPKHFVVDADYTRRKNTSESVKVWAIGQALAVDARLDILVDDVRGRDGVFPELVLFDCHACHRPMAEHRLQANTPLGAAAIPGLVRFNDSNLFMLRAIARVLDAKLGQALTQQAIALHRAIAGDGDVRQVVTQLKALTAQTRQRTEAADVSAALLTDVALALIDDGISGAHRDYAAAEQAAMAISTIGQMLAKHGGLRSASAFSAQWKKLNATLQYDEKFKPQEYVTRLRELRVSVAR